MASLNREHFFLPGKKSKHEGPGLLIVENKFKFQLNKRNKDHNVFYMACSMRRHPEFPCGAKARVQRFEDGHYCLVDVDVEHSHSSIQSQIQAEVLKQRMEDAVRNNPSAPVGTAIKNVKLQLAKDLVEDEERLMEIISSLGTKSGLEKRLYRIRQTKLGKTPRKRKEFSPENFIHEVFGSSNKLIALDSDKYNNWEEILNVNNKNTKYLWGRINEELLSYDCQGEIEEDEEIEEEDQGDTKRVIVYTTKELLRLLGKCTRGSLDGTFKSSCKLWKQNFIMMAKYSGIWIPVCWGWLPDKKERSYKMFLHLIMSKMTEYGFPFNVKEIICDYEINIHKAIDDLLPFADILGCFFHLVKAFKKKVDQKHLKKEYSENDQFRRFIKQASALSFLPLEDLEIGYRYLYNNSSFNDPKIMNFVEWFLEYIRKFWFDGVFPPYVWNTWGRSSDLTNNNQEGFNSRINKELGQKNPSPGILLCYINEVAMHSEQRIAEAKVGGAKPRQLRKHRTLAHKRYDIKKEYELARNMPNADMEQVVGEYMKIMGGNVIDSTLIDKVNYMTFSKDHQNVICEEDNNVSSWQILENSIVDEVFQSENPFSKREIGVTKKKQDMKQWWKDISCPSCKTGFNSKSSVRKCHSCDKFIHRKLACMILGEEETYFCLKCLPQKAKGKRKTPPQMSSCNLCDFKCYRRYNFQRHVDLVHRGVTERVEEPEQAEESMSTDERNISPLSDILKKLDLHHFMKSFIKEGVNLDIILTLNDNDMKECLREIGMVRFGDRQRFIVMIRCEKENTKQSVDSQRITDETRAHQNPQSNDTNEELLSDDLPDISILTKSSPLNENVSDYGVQATPKLPHCQLCEEATQHHCQICSKPICILYCSTQDPNSDNESHRIHKKGDVRCSVTPLSQSSPVVISSDESFVSDLSVPATEKNYVSPENSKVQDDHEDNNIDISLDTDCTSCSDPRPEDPVCRRCGKQLCFLCSEKDPESNNLGHRVHKTNDTRCYTGQRFECPCCSQNFTTADNIELHMTNEHPVTDMSDIEQQMQFDTPHEEVSVDNSEKGQLTLVPQAQSEKPIMSDEFDTSYIFDISPVKMINSGSPNILSESEEHIQENVISLLSPPNKRRRIRQNLKHVNFLDDSDDDPEWQMSPSCQQTSPINPFLQFIGAESDRRLNSQRKRGEKKAPSDFTCNICGVKLSRKDSLQRHKRLKH